MVDDKFAISLQQDLVTLLCWSDTHGKSVSLVVDSNLFEGDYRTIVERVLPFWEQHNSAPKQHAADLLSDILEDRGDRRGPTFRRILVQMMEIKDQINVDFVLRSMNLFVRAQSAKAVILESAEKLEAQGINSLDSVDALLHDYLIKRDVSLDAGMRLHEYDKVLDYFSRVHSEFKTGIKEFDEANIVPMRGKMFLFVAPAKRGKTWWLTQLGKMAFMQRKKVLHISLEIETEEVLQRYYQAMFGAAKREDLNKISTLKFDRAGKLDQIVSQSVEPPFAFDSMAIRDELHTRIGHWGIRSSNLLVKRFPMSSLTFGQLEAYLQSLETIEHFIPDMVLIDYPKIMKLDVKNLRTSLGQLFEQLRGLSQRRNFALGIVHQTSKAALDAHLVKSEHASEDWSTIATADFIVTFSQTAAEKLLGLARLFVDGARSEMDKFGVLITQNYRTGQFVLESTRLSDEYARLMESMKTLSEDEYDDDGDN